MNEAEKIGLYGGSFNPPHFGHTIAVKEARRALKLDRVLVMPAAVAPHKQTAGGASAEQRLEMTKLAFENIKFAEVRDDELQRTGPSYTADTVAALREEFPDARFYLICGADMFMSVQNWWNAEEIFASCTIVGLSREQGQTEEMREHAIWLGHRYGTATEVVENPVVEISSTELRAAIKAGEQSKFLPEQVSEYIAREGLYRD